MNPAIAERTPRSAAGDALLTDFYTLPMTQSFWRHGQADELASFELFVRSLPAERAYLVAAGITTALEHLERFAFSEQDLAYLAESGHFDPEFIDYLRQMRFTGSVDAVLDGTVLPAQAPILRVNAPRGQAAIVESALLTLINHQTMVASKAARIVTAAAGRPVWDFSLRRLHGLGSAVNVARAAYMSGCTGTATVAAGRELGIPITGTMAHHYVQSFGPDGEQAAFEQFLTDYPDNGVLLVDTYDTRRGVQRAIAAGLHTGIAPKAVRLDSGNLLDLAKQTRSQLDLVGFQETMILASNDLDEYAITELVAAGAPIDAFGVGTRLGTSSDAPCLGGVYKLVAQDVADDRPELLMKLAPGKETDPGHHQLWRGSDGRYVLALAEEQTPAELPDAERLLWPAIRDGELVERPLSLEASRANCADELERLDERHKRIDGPVELELERTPALMALRAQLSSS